MNFSSLSLSLSLSILGISMFKRKYFGCSTRGFLFYVSFFKIVIDTVWLYLTNELFTYFAYGWFFSIAIIVFCVISFVPTNVAMWSNNKNISKKYSLWEVFLTSCLPKKSTFVKKKSRLVILTESIWPKMG